MRKDYKNKNQKNSKNLQNNNVRLQDSLNHVNIENQKEQLKQLPAKTQTNKVKLENKSQQDVAKSKTKQTNKNIFAQIFKSNNLKTEKQKQQEMLSDETINSSKNQKSQILRKNIVITFLILLISFISVASIAISGNMTQSPVVTANVANTRIAQARLAELGYFEGEIDGIFDQDTISAIKSYQKDNNLSQTGNLDSTTAAAIGVTDNTQANTDLYLLAKLIHSEARGEPYEGQVAVGAVVLNRVDDAGFPNTLQGVIYQPWAFTALHDGQFSLEPNSTAYQAAQDALNGWDPTYGCVYYYNPQTATSSWIFSREIIVTIGRHVFCI